MSYNAACWVFVGVWEGWGGNGFFATARYPSESYSRYAADVFVFVKLNLELKTVWLLMNVNWHQCSFVLYIVYIDREKKY